MVPTISLLLLLISCTVKSLDLIFFITLVHINILAEAMGVTSKGAGLTGRHGWHVTPRAHWHLHPATAADKLNSSSRNISAQIDSAAATPTTCDS
jgi:hypothetical protein